MPPVLRAWKVRFGFVEQQNDFGDAHSCFRPSGYLFLAPYILRSSTLLLGTVVIKKEHFDERVLTILSSSEWHRTSKESVGMRSRYLLAWEGKWLNG